MKVLFNTREEWMREVDLDFGQVEDLIVRITALFKTIQEGMPFVQMTLYAGLIVRGQLVELRENLGTFMGEVERQKCYEVLERERGLVERWCKERHLVVRRGMFQEGK